MKVQFTWVALLLMIPLTACDQCSGTKSLKTAEIPGASGSTLATETVATSSGIELEPLTTQVSQELPPVELPSGLQLTDVRVGTGLEATEGKKLTVHYTGTLVDGSKFDSSRDRNQPFSFTLGSGMVIAGWEQGFKGMREGGIRKLVVPSALGYASETRGVIPADSTLLFEIELLKVE